MGKELSERSEELLGEKVEVAPVQEKELSLVSDESLLGVYGEIMENLRDDRSQVSNLVDTFSNMVLNDGDSSTASKEALVNLLKTRIETSDKLIITCHSIRFIIRSFA